MAGILIVEENKAIAKILAKRIASELGLLSASASSLKAVKAFLRKKNHECFAAIVDLSTPNAEFEKIIDCISGKGVASIVITDEFTDRMSEWMLSKNIIDYVVKEDSQDIENVLRTIFRVYKNQFIKVMVVDDSPILRKFINRLLTIQKYAVVEAADGLEALAQLKKNPDIKLVITDFQMPRMNGFELTSQIRKKFHDSPLAIIGISAYGSGLLSAKFLKKGANDFITKPFVNEEFNCRINQNIEILEHIEAVKQASNKDCLTGFYNRRYFFELGNRCVQNMEGASSRFSVAMIDVDHFKSINDRFGHNAGDAVLQHVSRILSENLSAADIVCRFGGDEFCILCSDGKREKIKAFFERIRRQVAREKVDVKKADIAITVSLGLATEFSGSLEATINRADELLYQAKKSGRNKVVADS